MWRRRGELKIGEADHHRKGHWWVPFPRISPECIDNSLLEVWRSECRSKSHCSFKVTEGFVQMDYSCGRRMEMRVEHLCGNCWDSNLWGVICLLFSELRPMVLLGELCILPWGFSPCEQMGKSGGSCTNDRVGQKVYFSSFKRNTSLFSQFQDGTDRSSLQSSKSRKARQNEPELKESQIFLHCIILSTPNYIKKANI